MVVDFSKLTKKELLENREKLAEVTNKLSEKVASLEGEILKERGRNTCLRAKISDWRRGFSVWQSEDGRIE